MAKVSNFIPTKGVNRAVKELRERTANNVANRAIRANTARNSVAVQRGIQSVEKEMAENAARALPIQDVINKNTGVEVPRKANSRRDVKSAKGSANVFNQTSNREIIETNTRYADQKIADAIANGREAELARQAQLKNKGVVRSQNIQGAGNRAQRRVDAINESLANAMADGREAAAQRTIKRDAKIRDRRAKQETAQELYNINQGAGNKAQRRIEEMRRNSPEGIEKQKAAIQKQIAIAEEAGDMDKLLELDEKLANVKPTQKKQSFQERKAERIQKNAQEQATAQAIAQEKKANLKIAQEMESGATNTMNGPGRGAAIVQETSPSGGNESAMKHLTDKMKGNNFVYNMAALGVGGGLVLNMANNKGQQSNAQLYGQY